PLFIYIMHLHNQKIEIYNTVEKNLYQMVYYATKSNYLTKQEVQLYPQLFPSSSYLIKLRNAKENSVFMDRFYMRNLFSKQKIAANSYQQVQNRLYDDMSTAENFFKNISNNVVEYYQLRIKHENDVYIPVEAYSKALDLILIKMKSQIPYLHLPNNRVLYTLFLILLVIVIYLILHLILHFYPFAMRFRHHPQVG
ncbi:MAG: hypothetical protein AAGG80_02410, partial [Pseudomonadota bacterium]